jgi:hypothetical protein
MDPGQYGAPFAGGRAMGNPSTPVRRTSHMDHSRNVARTGFSELNAKGADLLTKSATHSRSNAQSLSRRIEGAIDQKEGRTPKCSL